MSKKFYILIGLPGSGKSTWTKNFLAKQEEAFTIVSSDDIIEEEIAKFNANLREFEQDKRLNYSTGFEKFVGFATGEMKRRAKAAVAAGHNVIWDQTNMTPKSRKDKIGMFEGYQRNAVVFSITDDELFRRLKLRESQTGKSIPAFVIKNMAKSYQAPTKAEGFDNITYVRN